jgi:hypothetical protein
VRLCLNFLSQELGAPQSVISLLVMIVAVSFIGCGNDRPDRLEPGSYVRIGLSGQVGQIVYLDGPSYMIRVRASKPCTSTELNSFRRFEITPVAGIGDDSRAEANR